MSWLRPVFVSALGLFATLIPATAQAQLLTDYTTTPDQTNVATVMDNQGAAAAGGSTLQADYNRLFVNTPAGTRDSVQSLLPTTAYSMTGAANSLASMEERNITARLHTLRNRRALITHTVAAKYNEPLVKPLQETNEVLHDLRPNPTGNTRSSHRTLNNYRSYYPLLAGTESTPVPRSQELMIKTSAQRNDERPSLATRAATSIVEWSADIGGQRNVNATAQNGLPRRTLVPLSETKHPVMAEPSDEAYNIAVPQYDRSVGHPLDTHEIPAPYTHYTNEGAAQPINIISTPYPIYPSTDVPAASTNAPIIYGANDPRPPDLQPNQPELQLTPDEQQDLLQEPKAVEAPFTYEKIDQSKGLTTPHLGTPHPSGTRSTLKIIQPNQYAVITETSGTTDAALRTPPRATTDSWTLIWVDEDKDDEIKPTETTAAPLSRKPPPATTYGTYAVPLSESCAGSDTRWGIFLSTDVGFGSDELQRDSSKTKNTTVGFTAGADYRIQDNDYVGLALTYAHSNFSTGNLGDLETNSAALSLYGTTSYAQNAYADGYISLAYHTLDSERVVLSGDNTTRQANASPNGFQLNGKIETGYKFLFAGIDHTPFAGFRLAYSDFDGYTESGAGNFNLHVQDQNNLSAIGSIGMEIARSFAMSNGGALLPALRLGYNHEFGDDHTTIQAAFANMAGSAFSTNSEKKSRDWISLAPSITASLPNNWTLLAQYEHDFFRKDTNENRFNLAANYIW